MRHTWSLAEKHESCTIETFAIPLFFQECGILHQAYLKKTKKLQWLYFGRSQWKDPGSGMGPGLSVGCVGLLWTSSAPLAMEYRAPPPAPIPRVVKYKKNSGPRFLITIRRIAAGRTSAGQGFIDLRKSAPAVLYCQL